LQKKQKTHAKTQSRKGFAKKSLSHCGAAPSKTADKNSGERDLTDFEGRYSSNRFGVEGITLLFFFAQSLCLCVLACAFVFLFGYGSSALVLCDFDLYK